MGPLRLELTPPLPSTQPSAASLRSWTPMVIEEAAEPNANGVKFKTALLTEPVMPLRSNFRYASLSLLVRELVLFWTSRSVAFP